MSSLATHQRLFPYENPSISVTAERLANRCRYDGPPGTREAQKTRTLRGFRVAAEARFRPISALVISTTRPSGTPPHRRGPSRLRCLVSWPPRQAGRHPHLQPASQAVTKQAGVDHPFSPAACRDPVRELGVLLLVTGRPTRRGDDGAGEGTTCAPAQTEQTVRLLSVPGIGPLCAMAIQAFAPPIESFRRGRDLEVWLDLVPPQSPAGS